MKITHNIALSVSNREQSAFKKIGVDLPLGFTSFKIAEDDGRWSNVAVLARKFQAVDTAATDFSAAEINAAEYLGMEPAWHSGYPEPDDGGYLEATYDLSHYCRVCGIEKTQVAAFRMKRSPVWGKKSILQLNWVFDEYFVTPSAWLSVFKPFGLDRKPVLLDRTGEILDSVVELDASARHELSYDGDFEICKACGAKKYLPPIRGFYPLAKSVGDESIYKSEQYFGSGASANRRVFISAELYKAIVGAGLKGAEFIPCK